MQPIASRTGTFKGRVLPSENLVISNLDLRSIENYLNHGKLKAIAGSNRVSSRHPLNRNLDIKRIYYHNHFNHSSPIGFDIALVELKERVNFTLKLSKDEHGHQDMPIMNAICLPLEGKKYEFNDTARIAGWGLSNEDDPSSMPTKLLTTDILLSSPEICTAEYVQALKWDQPKEQQKKYDDFMCANYKTTRDACQSDSGGPLMQVSNSASTYPSH